MRIQFRERTTMRRRVATIVAIAVVIAMVVLSYVTYKVIGAGSWRRPKLRTVLIVTDAGGLLLAVGLGWLLSLHGGTQLLAPLSGFLLVAAGIVLLFGPWWLRIARDLVIERQARARAEIGRAHV